MQLADLQKAPGAPASLPGLTLPVHRTRTFDTPEFAGMTFLEVETRSALNRVSGMPFEWSINLYRGCSHACGYCFARPTHSYLNLDPLAGFDTQVVVKVNVVEVLRQELARPSWKGERVAIGTSTDAYQRAEGRYRLMPGVIDALAAGWTPFSILTKGTLITRDIPLLRRAAERVDVAATLTIGMLNRPLWRAVEPGTPSPRARLDAVRQLNAAGIPTGVMLAPIMPGLNDDPDELVELTTAAVEAGATHVTPTVLHLRPAVKPLFWTWLEATRPDLVDRYTELYGAPGGPGRGRATLREEVAGPLVAIVREARDAAWAPRGGAPGGGAAPDPSRPGEDRTGHGAAAPTRRPPGAPAQLTLLG